MSRLRQAVLLLLVAMLSAGPALAALAQVSCVAKSASCLMCCHPAHEMHGTARYTMPGSLQERSVPQGLNYQSPVPSPACLCSLPPSAAGIEAQPASTQNVELIGLTAQAAQTFAWPHRGQTDARAPASAALPHTARPASAPLPLRV